METAIQPLTELHKWCNWLSLCVCGETDRRDGMVVTLHNRKACLNGKSSIQRKAEGDNYCNTREITTSDAP